MLAAPVELVRLAALVAVGERFGSGAIAFSGPFDGALLALRRRRALRTVRSVVFCCHGWVPVQTPYYHRLAHPRTLLLFLQDQSASISKKKGLHLAGAKPESAASLILFDCFQIPSGTGVDAATDPIVAAIECFPEGTPIKRPLTTSLAVPPPDQSQVPKAEPAKEAPSPPSWRETAPIAAALGAILSAMESGPKVGPALKAYRSAIRRQGQEAATLGGPDAMEAVLRPVVEAAPDQAVREVALTEAWAELPGWRS